MPSMAGIGDLRVPCSRSPKTRCKGAANRLLHFHMADVPLGSVICTASLALQRKGKTWFATRLPGEGSNQTWSQQGQARQCFLHIMVGAECTELFQCVTLTVQAHLQPWSTCFVLLSLILSVCKPRLAALQCLYLSYVVMPRDSVFLLHARIQRVRIHYYCLMVYLEKNQMCSAVLECF